MDVPGAVISGFKSSRLIGGFSRGPRLDLTLIASSPGGMDIGPRLTVPMSSEFATVIASEAAAGEPKNVFPGPLSPADTTATIPLATAVLTAMLIASVPLDGAAL